jgi:O-antigen/teichoic acid export membrane protein
LLERIGEINNRLQRLLSSQTVKSVSLLAGGTAFAGAIAVAILPILTRLYTPDELGALAAFNGIIAVIAVAVALRFDIAIPIPENDEDAVNVMALALAFAGIISLIIGILCFFFRSQIVNLIDQPELNKYLLLVPVGIFLGAAFSSFQNWAVRWKEFQFLSHSRVVQATAVAFVQIGFGWFRQGEIGLLLGNLTNPGLFSLAMAYRIATRHIRLIRAVTVSKMYALFVEYHRFPKYSVIEALFNEGGMHVPLILIGSLASKSELGFLFLAVTIMNAPMGLLGRAFAQVYFSQAPTEFRRNNLAEFTSRSFGNLMRVGVGPLLFGAIVAPAFFPFIFGSGWVRTGTLLLWLAPSMAAQFVTTPIATALHICGALRLASYLQVLGFVMRTGSVLVAFRFGLASEAYAVSGFLFYLIYLAVVLSTAKVRWIQLTAEVKRSALFIFGWIGAGTVIAFFAS